MKIELVIFDMDGLMVNTEELYFKSWLKTISNMGFQGTREIYIKSIGMKDDACKKVFADCYGDKLDVDQLWSDTEVNAQELLKSGFMKAKKGLFNLIDYLDEKGIKKAIASSSYFAHIDRNLKLTGINYKFDYIISGADLKESKPNPEIFNKVCQELQINKENTIVLEDSLNGVRAAYNAEIKCIAIPDMVEPDEEYRKKAFKIVNDLDVVVNFLKESIN